MPREDTERRKSLAERMVAVRREVLQTFVPPHEEMTAVDLLIRTDDDGATRAFVMVMVNDRQVTLSRGGWEFLLPQLLRMVYGGRVAEAGIHKTLSSVDPDAAAVEAIVAETIRHFGSMVLDPHPLEMREVPVNKGRDPEEMRARLKRKEGSE